MPEVDSPFAWERKASSNLQAISPLACQAFLLISVEGFTSAEAAEILGVEEARIGDLLTEAGRELSQRIATDIMIIEDEPLIAMNLEYVVEELGHKVVGVARTRTQAVELSARPRPS